MRFPFLMSIASLALAAGGYAQEAGKPQEKEPKTVVKATYLITGLH